MINPKHPLECYNIHQEIFIKHVTEKDREYQILRISYCNAVYLYYKLQLNVSVYDYKEWLNGIVDEKLRFVFKSKGFRECQKTFSFIRFMHKKRNISEEDYIKEKMGNEKYYRYKILCQNYLMR